MTFEELLPKFIYSGISIFIVFLLRSLVIRLVKRYAKIHERLQQRTNLIIKYFDFAFIFILVFWNILIWGVKFSDVGLVFSSMFAVIGVALFAQWSILSNITSGIIMFFTFPYKIGDRIKIHDKDFIPEVLIIEDIKTFHIILKSENGNVHSYPNNLILQKGVSMVTDAYINDEHDENENKNLSKIHD